MVKKNKPRRQRVYGVTPASSRRRFTQYLLRLSRVKTGMRVGLPRAGDKQRTRRTYGHLHGCLFYLCCRAFQHHAPHLYPPSSFRYNAGRVRGLRARLGIETCWRGHVGYLSSVFVIVVGFIVLAAPAGHSRSNMKDGMLFICTAWRTVKTSTGKRFLAQRVAGKGLAAMAQT